MMTSVTSAAAGTGSPSTATRSLPPGMERRLGEAPTRSELPELAHDPFGDSGETYQMEKDGLACATLLHPSYGAIGRGSFSPPSSSRRGRRKFNSTSAIPEASFEHVSWAGLVDLKSVLILPIQTSVLSMSGTFFGRVERASDICFIPRISIT